jgi:hypothetical protein
VEERVSGALQLAHFVFGSATIVGARPFGARELWCLTRLEWTRSLEPSLSPSQRFVRDIARRHMKALERGARPRNPLQLVSCFFAAIGSAISNRFRARFHRRPTSLEPVTLFTAPVGDCLVAHDAKTGCVHVLDRVAATVWTTTKTEADAHRLESLLATRGIEERTTRMAIDRLVDRGLLRERHARA